MDVGGGEFDTVGFFGGVDFNFFNIVEIAVSFNRRGKQLLQFSFDRCGVNWLL